MVPAIPAGKEVLPAVPAEAERWYQRYRLARKRYQLSKEVVPTIVVKVEVVPAEPAESKGGTGGSTVREIGTKDE